MDKSITLDNVFDDLKLPENTPVYRAFFFLPVPLEGASYETNFFPMINTTKYDAAIVDVVTKWTNSTQNQETSIYMVKTFVQIVMFSTIII